MSETRRIKIGGCSPYETDIQKKIVKAFDLFDETKTGRVNYSDVGTVIRYLGAYPSEGDIEKLLSEVEGVESGQMHISDVLPVLTKVFLEDRFRPVRKEKLLRAFELLDEEKKGVIEGHVMKEFLTKYGEPFSETEIKVFLDDIEDKKTETIDYKKYCDQLFEK